MCVCVCVRVTAAQYVPVLNEREMNVVCVSVCVSVCAVEEGVCPLLEQCVCVCICV